MLARVRAHPCHLRPSSRQTRTMPPPPPRTRGNPAPRAPGPPAPPAASPAIRQRLPATRCGSVSNTTCAAVVGRRLCRPALLRPHSFDLARFCDGFKLLLEKRFPCQRASRSLPAPRPQHGSKPRRRACPRLTSGALVPGRPGHAPGARAGGPATPGPFTPARGWAGSRRWESAGPC